MQILIPDSWLREYLHTNATPKDIQRCLSLCGPSIERLHEKDGDYIYDIEVTTNRVDCMSVIGIAREAVAILPQFGFTAKLISNPFKTSPSNISTKVDYLSVKLDPILCSKFSAIKISNVKVAPSPDWVVKKLTQIGLRSLNNVIDISNLLMFELGQPIHMYDYDKIQGSAMHMRESEKGESVITLDGQTHALPGHDIVISDASGKLIDLCGIMGGQLSAIDENTKNVLLFVQTYEPVHIRRTSMALSHRTDAAVLFEKGLVADSVLPTLQKALKLTLQLAGGTAAEKIIDLSAEELGPRVVQFQQPLTPFVNTRLGIKLTSSQIKTILKNLNIIVKSDTKVEVPWYRKLDIQIPEDIAEEVARIYGYHNLPSHLMTGPLPTNRDDKEFNWISKIKSMLKYLGFTETYTYSLTPSGTGLKLKNPLSSEWVYLRTSLQPSHQSVLNENRGRQDRLLFFEIANVYLPQTNNLPTEELHLIMSTNQPKSSQLKGYMTALCQQLGVPDFSFNPVTIDNDTYIEINLHQLLSSATSIKTYQPPTKFAPIIEDINVTLNQPYSELITAITQLSPWIKDIALVDRYQNRLTLRLTFLSAEKQLSSADIAPIRDQLTQYNLG